MNNPLTKLKSTAAYRFVAANVTVLFVAIIVGALLVSCFVLYLDNQSMHNTLDGATILTGPVTVQTPCADSLTHSR
jgi:hypothetical protein